MLDNGGTHIARATKAWLAQHPGFVVDHTPRHASWLNQVELFFSTSVPSARSAAKYRSRLTGH